MLHITNQTCNVGKMANLSPAKRTLHVLLVILGLVQSRSKEINTIFTQCL